MHTCVALSVAVAAFAGSVHGSVMTFESLQQTGNTNNIISPFDYTENGYRITGAVSRFGTGSSIYYGSTAIIPQGSVPFPLQLTQANGGAFDLLSLDLAERGNAFNCLIIVTGTFADGSGIISATLTTDAVFQTGDLASFQTFTLAGFTNLSSVTFTFDSNAFLRPQIDNIVAVPTTVPAPAAAALLGVGGLMASRRRRG